MRNENRVEPTRKVSFAIPPEPTEAMVEAENGLREANPTLYWCPRCKRPSERLWHFCEKGPPLIPQEDVETCCVEVPLSALAASPGCRGAELAEALEWYADEDNWRQKEHALAPSCRAEAAAFGFDVPVTLMPSKVEKDKGEKARKALAAVRASGEAGHDA